MKKLLALMASVVLSSSLYAADFVENVHYEVLDQQQSENKEVVEYFSFYCPHCLAFETVANSLSKDLPRDVNFDKRSISFIGKNNMGVPISKSYAVMKLLGKDQKLVPAMFHKMQRSGSPLQSVDELRIWFSEQGVSKASFDSTYNSSKAFELQRSYDEGFLKAKLNSVPSFIVNNKYLIILGSFKNYEEFLSLVEYLLDK